MWGENSSTSGGRVPASQASEKTLKWEQIPTFQIGQLIESSFIYEGRLAEVGKKSCRSYRNEMHACMTQHHLFLISGTETRVKVLPPQLSICSITITLLIRAAWRSVYQKPAFDLWSPSANCAWDSLQVAAATYTATRRKWWARGNAILALN